ncbi:MAG: hypothetical protein U0931_22185 [Vulcanimicrobiota bacterium]
MFVEKAIKAQLHLGSAVEDKADSNFVCPRCGGPAEMETFWSTSPNRPGLKILKRQVFCGKRPRRGFRNRPSTNCPVVVEEIGTEAISESPRKLQLSLVRLDVPAPVAVLPEESGMEQSESPAGGSQTLSSGRRSGQGMGPDGFAGSAGRSPAAVGRVLVSDESGPDLAIELDRVIEFMAGLPEEGVQELLQLARLECQRAQLRSRLEVRLRDIKKAR